MSNEGFFAIVYGMPYPKVSVLITTYERPRFIDRAIGSVLQQTFTDWEIVVVDDSASDATKKAVGDFLKKDNRIRYFHREKKGTIAQASNFGLREARGEYIAILDDDDFWSDESKLGEQVSFLDSHREYVGCGGGFVTIDEHGKETTKILKPETNHAIRRHALMANPMANSTTLFRLSAARHVGFYDETLPQFADWDFWLKMGLSGKLHNVSKYYASYMMWQEGASFAHQKVNARSALRIVRRYRGKYPGFITAYMMACLYFCYAHLPEAIKKITNPILSRAKKFLFGVRL